MSGEECEDEVMGDDNESADNEGDTSSNVDDTMAKQTGGKSLNNISSTQNYYFLLLYSGISYYFDLYATL